MNKILDIIRELIPIMDDASTRSIGLHKGLMGDALTIVDRYGMHGEKDIARVVQDRLEPRGEGSEKSYRSVPVKTAQADALALVAAFNGVRDLIHLASGEGALDEVAWLIEFPADRHAPIRYYSAGERPVMSADHATRFARKRDAEATIKAQDLKRGAAMDHKWIVQPQVEAGEADNG